MSTFTHQRVRVVICYCCLCGLDRTQVKKKKKSVEDSDLCCSLDQLLLKAVFVNVLWRPLPFYPLLSGALISNLFRMHRQPRA